MTDTNEQRYEQTFAVGDHADVTLRNVRGAVDIRGWDQPQVSIIAVKTLGTEWGAREAFDQTTVEMDHDGPRVRVRTQRQGDGGIFGWIGIGRTPPVVSYTIRVPATSNISVRTVNGPLTVAGIIGTLYLRTVEGAITINQVSGQIITSGVDAAVNGSEIGGTVAAKSVSGNISLTQSQLTSFWSKAVSGNVSLETTIDPTGNYESHSVDGSFRLRVPRDSRIAADMTSMSGRLVCDLPASVSHDVGGRWRANVNGGGASVLLKTLSGDLTINEATNLRGAAPVTSQPAAAPAPANRDWPEMSILKDVESGALSVEQAIARLAELDKGA
jgi:hypothetical protein